MAKFMISPTETEINAMIDRVNRGNPTHLEKMNARAKKSKTEKLTEAAFREVHENEPSIVSKTRRKKGKEAAKEQKAAIALSKARRAGARIPKR
jgi:hypothetical protein